MVSERPASDYSSESDDTDAVRLSDTDDSEDASEYEIDYIMGERQSHAEDDAGIIAPKTFYLIKWAGYSKYKATWEPVENLLTADVTLRSWEAEKYKHDNGIKIPFNVDKWQHGVDAIRAKRLRRHHRRNKKRAKLGRPVVIYSEDEDESIAVAATGEDSTQSGTASNDPIRRHSHNGPTAHERSVASLTITNLVQSSHNPSGRSDTSTSSPASTQKTRDTTATVVSNRRNSNLPRAAHVARIGPPKKVGQAAPMQPIFKNVFDAGNSSQKQSAAVARTHESEQFKNLKHRNNTWKKLRQESAPNLSNLTLRSLTNGETVASPDTPLAGTSAIDFNQTAAPSSMARSHNPELGYSKNNSSSTGILTCYYYKNNSCRFGEYCGLAHYDTGLVAPNNKSRTLITCPHWLSGSCFKEEADCVFAHEITNYISDRKTSRILPLDKSWAQELLQKHSNNQISFRGTTENPNSKSYTCYYWATKGFCNKADHNCLFAHDLRDEVKVPSGKPLPASNFPLLLRYMSSCPVPVGPTFNNPPTESAEPTTIFHSDPPLILQESPGSQKEISSENDQTALTACNKDSPIAPRETKNSGLVPISLAVSITTRFNYSYKSDTLKLDMQAELSGMDPSCRTWFMGLSQGASIVEFKHLWNSETARQCFDPTKHELYASGFFGVFSNIDRLIGNLKLFRAGVLAFHEEYSLIVFPASQEDWEFMGEPVKPSKAALQYRLFSPINPPPKTSNYIPNQLVCTVDLEQMFPLAANKAEKRVFLIFPFRREPIFKGLIKAFQQAGATVYHSGKDGSWAYFHKQVSLMRKSGVIVFEPEFVSFHCVPWLSHFLRYDACKTFRLRTLEPPTFETIFPSGVACYFADSIITDQPEKTLKSLKKLKGLIDEAPAKVKILGRPGMLDWLQKLTADEHAVIRTKNSTEYNYTRWKSIYCLLKSILDDHSSFSTNSILDIFKLSQLTLESTPPPDSPFYFLPTGMFKKFDMLWEKPFKQTSLDVRQEADQLMLDWFAGWASAHATEFRRFFFFARESEGVVEQWKSNYPHLIISATPDDGLHMRLDEARAKT